MDDELELTFLNLEFRMLLVEEGLRDAKEKAEQLLIDIEKFKQIHLATNDEEDYWRAD